MLALARIRQYGDPVLRMKAREIEDVDDDVRRLAERMTALMHEAQGVGLAATQVGVLRRLFVFTDAGEDRVLVNPVITQALRQGRAGRRGMPVAARGARAGRAPGRGHHRRPRRRRRAGEARARAARRRGSCSTSSTTWTECSSSIAPTTSPGGRRKASSGRSRCSALGEDRGRRHRALRRRCPERLASHARDQLLSSLDRMRPPGAGASSRRLRPRRPQSRSGSRCCNPMCWKPGWSSDAPTVVVVAYGRLVPESLLGRAPLAERASVAPPTLAGRRAGRARADGRGRGDGRHDHRAREGARCGADRRAAATRDRAGGRRRSALRQGCAARGRAPRRRSRRP